MQKSVIALAANGSDSKHLREIVPFATNEIMKDDPRLATTKVYRRSELVSERVRQDLDKCLLFAGTC